MLSLDAPQSSPPGAIGPYLNGLFPDAPPSLGGSWELEDPMPGIDIQAPLRILPLPGSEDLLVLNKRGEIWQVSLENQQKELFFDLKDRVFKKGEAGAVGFSNIIGPSKLGDKQFVSKFTTTKLV